MPDINGSIGNGGIDSSNMTNDVVVGDGGIDSSNMTNDVVVGDGGIVPVKWETCSEECEIVRETPRLVRSAP